MTKASQAPAPFALTIPRRAVKLGDQEVLFRGLSFDDIAVLIGEFDEEIDTFAARFSAAKSDAEATMVMGQQLLNEAPQLVCMGFALAMDAEDLAAAAQVFAKTPSGFQLQALETIYGLTVEPGGGAKEFFGRLTNLFPSLGGLLGDASHLGESTGT